MRLVGRIGSRSVVDTAGPHRDARTRRFGCGLAAWFCARSRFTLPENTRKSQRLDRLTCCNLRENLQVTVLA